MPLLARFLYFSDKEMILQHAWNMPELLYNNNCITIFPDFSAAFQSVKQCLRDRSLPYSMLYPARLLLVHKGKVQFFTSPKEATR